MKIQLWLLHLTPQENALAFPYLLELGARWDLRDIPPRPGAVDKCVQGQATPQVGFRQGIPLLQPLRLGICMQNGQNRARL